MSLTDGGLLAVLALMALFGITSMMLRRSHRQLLSRERPSTAFATPAPTRRERGHPQEAPREFVDWEVKIHDLGRELSAQIDSKMSALQQIIADADRAAARLEAALSSAGREDHSEPPKVQTIPANSPASALSPRAEHEREQVYVLSDYGFEPADIARRVDLPLGEVRTILALRPNRPE